MATVKEKILKKKKKKRERERELTIRESPYGSQRVLHRNTVAGREWQVFKVLKGKNLQPDTLPSKTII